MMRTLAPLVLSLFAAGCSSTSRRPPLELIPDMKHQLKFKPQTASALFDDGRSSRAPVPGTVARSQLREDGVFFTGIENGAYAGKNPLPLDRRTLERGQERFNIYCAPCHDKAATGRGIVALRSSWLAGDLREQRIRGMADGQLFDTITHGKRTMPGYRFQIPEHDRWAIVAYVRALQRAANGTLADVPQELRSDLR